LELAHGPPIVQSCWGTLMTTTCNNDGGDRAFVR
jgi:hypothetical protein